MAKSRESAADLLREVDRLLANPKMTSYRKQPGWTRCSNGAWWSPGTLEKVDELLSKADAVDESPYLALYRRASARMVTGRLDEALSDLKLLEERKSIYATGVFPIQLYLARGERDVAQRYLDEINERNKAKGIPKQKFSDFRLD